MSSLRQYLKIKTILFIFFITLLGICIVLFLISYTQVREIRIIGLRSGDKVFGLSNLKSLSLIFLNDEEIQGIIKQNNPLISQILIKKIYPHTVSLTLSYYHEAVYLKTDKGLLLLEDGGHILKKIPLSEKKDTVPILSYFQTIHFDNYQPGDQIKLRDITMAIQFLKALTDEGYQVNTIDIDGVSVLGFNLREKRIVFSCEKNIDEQLYQLHEIIHQFKIQGKEYKKLDLRFNRPVVEFVEKL